MRLLLLLLLLVSSLQFKAQDYCLSEITTINTPYEHQHANNLEDNSKQEDQTVYVCTGEYAYTFHSTHTCSGLNNCKGDIISATLSYAQNVLGRSFCCKCWSNTDGRCKDDNPSYSSGGGGGSSPEAMAAIAIAVVATSAFILSNDFYIHGNAGYYYYSGGGSGVSLGLRKTFKNSALEYGAHCINGSWGGNINYIHNIFPNKIPVIKLYVGPTIHWMHGGIGVGAVSSAQLQLLKRLKLDARFELSSRATQFQLGLIFNYQRKYFWNR